MYVLNSVRGMGCVVWHPILSGLYKEGKVKLLGNGETPSCVWWGIQTSQSINQSNIYFIVHKCMPKNLQVYVDNKVTFLKWEDNGLILSKIWVCNVQWKMGAIALSYPPYCYWWLIMKKRGWKLYPSPNPNPGGVRKCNSAGKC